MRPTAVSRMKEIRGAPQGRKGANVTKKHPLPNPLPQVGEGINADVCAPICEAAPIELVPQAFIQQARQGSPLAENALTRPQAKNPLHGLTLQTILTELVEFGGWAGVGEQVNIRCFTHEPSIASSLKFLRKTPWARAKVESLYLYMVRQKAREQKVQTRNTALPELPKPPDQ
jgi:uncharacterized protein (DUF2132 family)